MDERCHWDDDKPCTGPAGCAFGDYDDSFVPGLCARLTAHDRAVREAVYDGVLVAFPRRRK